jgi:dTDP-4-dehydrorhamnose reductase
VDRAETEISLANAINAIAPFELARWCKSREIPFVHFSTDYVYDGDGTEPRTEAASPRPLNAYGRSKLDGDEAVESVGGDFMIFVGLRQPG